MKILPYLYLTLSISGENDDLSESEDVSNEIDYELSDLLVDNKGVPVEEYPIIVGSSSQQVFSISSIDGDIHWMKTIGERVNSVPIISLENVAYITGKLSVLYFIKAW